MIEASLISRPHVPSYNVARMLPTEEALCPLPWIWWICDLWKVAISYDFQRQVIKNISLPCSLVFLGNSCAPCCGRDRDETERCSTNSPDEVPACPARLDSVSEGFFSRWFCPVTEISLSHEIPPLCIQVFPAKASDIDRDVVLVPVWIRADLKDTIR